WKLKDEEPVPLLLTYQHPPDTTPSADEFHLATAALEVLAKIPFASGKPIETSVTVRRRQVQVRWPITPPRRAT
ncbi:hypothetical protein, partial [Pseudomonas sp. PNPG3]|uniref:hypothetical protein n=1 Tax=Pseudomonas sp. PNPG3 TaxID=2919497 RepID=UPI001FFC99CF